MRKPVIVVAALIAMVIIALTAAEQAHAHQSGWQRNREASWYGPGFEGRQTACGKTLYSATSWWVAGFKTNYMHCGLKVRICKSGTTRCVNVTVQDRGAVHSGRRDWDMTRRVRDALRCPSTCNIRWRTYYRWP